MDCSDAMAKFPKRAIHFNFHTMPGCHDLGPQFDAGRFVATLQKARVEYINFFAKYNLGFCYYPTKIGTGHPGLQFDLMGKIIRAVQFKLDKLIGYQLIVLDLNSPIANSCTRYTSCRNT